MPARNSANRPKSRRDTASTASPDWAQAPANHHNQATSNGEDDMDGPTGTTMDATKTRANFTQTAVELSSFSQGNIEALMKSGQAWAAGCQAFSQTITATTQSQVDRSLAAWKALLSVRSLQQAVELRRNLAQTCLETAATDASKVANASLRLVEDTVAPLAERVSLAMETLAPRTH
jgi:hypothetical protein